MQSFEIHLNDWSRILFGNTPPEFFIELILRVTFIYLLIIFCIRLMGKRMAAQLSRNELVAIASLAASIGIPIQTPDRGLLPALLVALIVVGAQQLVARISSHNERFERRSQGNISILVDDCCLQMKELRRVRVSRGEIFGRLRARRILHLGQVKRMYFEAGGDFSLIRNDQDIPGLSILPADDPDFLAEQAFSRDFYVCDNCGKAKASQQGSCENCGENIFVRPVTGMLPGTI
jgi:uncharacterized membrane protein YcaP (DUF421 family)